MSWRDTTPRTTHLVRGSGPHSLVTYRHIITRISIAIASVVAVRRPGKWPGICRSSADLRMESSPSPHATMRVRKTGLRTSGWALIIACRLERCGSSVYVQKKWSSTKASGAWILVDSGCVLSDALAADTRRCGELVSTTADMMEIGMCRSLGHER